ncbi:MAG: CBS domain-containing protein [Deltaproteobacteria bacterium]|nr:CBS domain-containing protein [Deltaproteobacteria bacterium]
MKTRDFMIQPVISVYEDTSLEEVARIMLDKGIGGIPVLNRNGALVGMITQSDFAAKEKGIPFSTYRAPQVLGQWLGQDGLERIYERARTMKAADIMSSNVHTVEEERPVEDAVELMLKHDINRIPVMREKKLVGMVSRHDLLRLVTSRED